MARRNYDNDVTEDAPAVQAPTPALTTDGEENAFYHWSKRNGVYRPCGLTQDTIPAGIYEIDNDNQGWFLSRVKFPSDNLLRLPGMPIDFILDQINVPTRMTSKSAGREPSMVKGRRGGGRFGRTGR